MTEEYEDEEYGFLEVPALVKVISFLFQVFVIFLTMLGSFMVLFGIGGQGTEDIGANGLSDVFFGMLIFGLGTFGLFVGTGMWKGRNWARTVFLLGTIFPLAFSVLMFMTDPIRGIFGSLVSCSVMGYLLFNKKVRNVFS